MESGNWKGTLSNFPGSVVLREQLCWRTGVWRLINFVFFFTDP